MVPIKMARQVSQTQINDLDNDCLSLVFRQFTLQNMIRLRIVCKRWRSMIELICQGKTSLQLFALKKDACCYLQFAKRCNIHDYNDVNSFELSSNKLILSGPSLELSLFLPSIFPNVRKLIYRCKLDLVPLLKSWTNLEFLCLYMQNCEEHEKIRAYSIINSILTLKRLHLFVYGRVILENMPILARLERFSLNYYFGNIVSILAQLGPPIRRLYLDYIPCDLGQLRQLVQMQPEFGTNLTHLIVVNIRSNQSSVQDRKQFLQLICNNFLALTHLDVTFTNQVRK